jgi:hypothetical protein
VSTDQQWATGGRQGQQHEQIHERNRPLDERYRPFLGPYIIALAALPVLESISYLVRRVDPNLGFLILWCWVASGFVLALAAIGIGVKVSKRLSFIVAHVALTLIVGGSMAGLTTAIGWPGVWIVLHAFASAIFATSWTLYRIDSLRSAARGDTRDVWGALFGLRTSRPTKISQPDDAHIVVEIAHGPGETKQDVQSASKKMESALNAIEGRTTVTSDGRAGHTTVSFSTEDVFADWKDWPGPSHPGMSFAYPLRTAYYETGEDQWFSLCATQKLRSPHTSFRSDMDTFLGAVGATGAGKSGFLNNLVAEALTRSDVIPCWIDKAKILQNAGWCLDMLGMAGDAGVAVDFTRALRLLAEYRVQLFGQVSLDAIMDPGAAADDVGRKWTPQLAVETGEAAILAVVDEADTAIKGAAWEWLSARGRSLGIFLVPATPRASAAEVPAIVRGSVGAWKTYAIGDNYSDGFTISSETADAGADPKKLRDVGLHYLDRAPGVDKRMFPVLAREYRSSTKVLRQRVLTARASFDPMTFTPGAIAAMGEFYERCNPRRLLVPRVADADRGALEPVTPAMPYAPAGGVIGDLMRALVDGTVQGTPAEVEEARRILAANQSAPNMTASDRTAEEDDDEYEQDEEEDDMRATPTGVDLDDDIAAPVDPRTLYDADDARELAGIDPRQAIDTRVGPDAITLDAPGDKPVWSAADTEAEFDRVLVQFADTGRMEFGNPDVLTAMQCEFKAYTVSRRLDALAEGERLAPPGLTIERQGRGRFLIVRSAPSPRPRNPEGN